MEYKHGGDIYSQEIITDFSANINFLGMPQRVRDAAISAVDASMNYPDTDYRSLREALAKREWEMNSHFGILPEDILCANGSSELFTSLAEAYRPTNALIAIPSYYEYEHSLLNVGCKVEHFQLKAEREFVLDSEFLNAAGDFVRKIMSGKDLSGESAPRAMILLGNPNNPTGRIIEKEILRSLIALCREYHLLMVLDECFFDFLNTDDKLLTYSGATEVSENPYLFVIRSFTKIYAMPGLRFGYAICSNHNLLGNMRERLQPWNVSLVAQKAAEAAASEYTFVSQTAAEVSYNRKEMRRILSHAGYQVFPSSANFIFLRGPEDLDKFCLKYGYLIRNCRNFDGLVSAGYRQGFFRICVRSQKENRSLADCMYKRAGVPLKE